MTRLACLLALVTLTAAPLPLLAQTPGAGYSLTARDILSDPSLLTPVIAGLSANPELHRLHALAVSEGRFAGDIVDFAYAWVAVNGVFAAPVAQTGSPCDDPNRNPNMMIWCPDAH